MAGKVNKKPLTLTQALAQLLSNTLLPDLKERAVQPGVSSALSRQWQAEKAAHRTADEFPAWQERTLEQVGAAWVLSCVFVRTLEDRDLLARRRLAGPGAQDSEQLFFELCPSLTARDYLLTVFREIGGLPSADDLFGARHNPLWRLSPSNDGVRALLDFFRQSGEQGELAWRFGVSDTRFLGDLYQDLSEDVRKRYALFQTPDFVEHFILDQTLDPAIAEFGLENVRLIDPTCGSGHFLLGAFERLLERRRQTAPAIDVREHAVAALGQVCGVDINPYAVAIARFRLTLSYLQHAGVTKLALAPRLPLNLVVADSLLYGAKNTSMLFVEHKSMSGDYRAWDGEMFALDDPQAAQRIFSQRYQAVVGNPPYITCKDKVLREVYRDRYRSASGKYALSAPFVEAFLGLACPLGYWGMINSNNFTNSSFGRTLVEDVLPDYAISLIVDCSRIKVSGHGTPTVILVGTNTAPSSDKVRVVVGKSAETSMQDDDGPAGGAAWNSMVKHYGTPMYEDGYLAVVDTPRDDISKHPWTFDAGPSAALRIKLRTALTDTCTRYVSDVGPASFSGQDPVFTVSETTVSQLEPEMVFPITAGSDVRDWTAGVSGWALVPLDSNRELIGAYDPNTRWGRYLWPYRTALEDVGTFGGKTRAEAGEKWWTWYRWIPERYRLLKRIAYSSMTTHNHFVMVDNTHVLNGKAPVVVIRDEATGLAEGILAYLNSSVACYFMKSKPKGATDANRNHPDPARMAFEFTGALVRRIPFPTEHVIKGLVDLGVRLVALGSQRASLLRTGTIEKAVVAGESLRALFDEVWANFERLRDQMIFLQEEIDWRVYCAVGLATDAMIWQGTLDGVSIPRGRRSFERVLGRVTFLRKRGRPIPLEVAEIPASLLPMPDELETLVVDRAEAIRRNSQLGELESYQYKRLWRDTEENIPEREWRSREERRMVESVLLGRMEEHFIRSPERITPVFALELDLDRSVLERVADFMGFGDCKRMLLGFVERNAVPFASADVFSESGLRKYSRLCGVWSYQRYRCTDSGGGRPEAVRFANGGRDSDVDYRRGTIAALRGQLNVPKEHFISYPGCERDGDPSPLIGWAGWNHLQRAQALVALYQERKNEDGWPRERLMSMLVGLHELMFWLEQWHSKPEAGSPDPAREFKQFLDAELRAHQLTTDDLEAWRPPARTAKRAKPAGRSEDAASKPKRGRGKAKTT